MKFSAKTYQEAMRLARDAFGDDTIIIQNRRLPEGGIEVTAMSGGDVPTYDNAPEPFDRQTTHAPPVTDNTLDGLSKEQVEQLLLLARSRTSPAAVKEDTRGSVHSRVSPPAVTGSSFDEAMSQRAAPYRRNRGLVSYPEFDDEAAVFRPSSGRVPAQEAPLERPLRVVATETAHSYAHEEETAEVVTVAAHVAPVTELPVKPALTESKPVEPVAEAAPGTPSDEFDKDLKAADAIAQWSKRLLGDVEGLQDNIRRKVLPRMKEGRTYAQLFERLNSIGLKKNVCQKIINSLPANILLGQVDESEALQYLEHAIAQTLPVMKTPELWGKDKKIITLVGSTGIGKSTSLAKVAHRFALAEGENNVIILTLDPDHQEPLRSHCDALGIQFEVIKEYESLGDAITKALTQYQLILLDTAGYGHRNDKLDAHFERLAACGHPVQPVLVLNANSDIESLEVMASTYMTVAETHNMPIENAIISKLDEAARVGGVLNTVAHLGLEISYQSSGNDILDGFEKANLIGMIKEAVSQSHGLEEGGGLFSMEDQGARFEATRQEILSNIVKMHSALRGLRQELNNKEAPSIPGVATYKE